MSDKKNFILVGGAGRSGTTYVAAALGRHPSIATFPGVELKILYERDGLVDLGWVLCETFSPNRAWVGLARFRALMNQLRNGGFDQPLLEGPGIYRGVNRALEMFYDVIAPEGIGRPMNKSDYCLAARNFFSELAALGIKCKPNATYFLEKTPHNLLAPYSLVDFVDNPLCVHVSRDPRATAVSLVSQSWGPTTLSSAAAWVKSYYDQWFSIRNEYSKLGLSLVELSIEDVVENPAEHSRCLLADLGLENTPIFADVNGNLLAAGRNNIGFEDMHLLNERLGPIAKKLGYECSWT